MNRFVHKLIFVLFAGLCLAPLARADLLDEEPITPAPGSSAAPSPTPPGAPVPTPSPVPAPGSGSGAKPGKKPSLSKEEGEPSKKPQQGGVLAPKGGGKKKAPGQKGDAEEPVLFESKGLRGLREKGFVELVENVVVSQGTMRLEADHAQVAYDEVTKEVVKVTADGNVKMFKTDEDSGDKIKAYGDTVIFMNKERIVTLEGNARLWRGADLVRGKKITYELDTGWIRADRVAGEVHPADKVPEAKP